MYLQGGEIVNSYNYSKMQLLKTAEKGNTLKKKKGFMQRCRTEDTYLFT